jgi:TIR domain
MGHDVFLSYSTRDRDAAEAVCTALERRGMSVWMAPRDILAGLPWPGQIIQGIDNARSVVLIFSAAANESEQIEREVQRAVDRRLKVVPFRIEDVRPKEDLAYSIGNVQWLDAFSRPMEPHYDQLAKVLRQIASLPEPSPEPAPLPHSALPLFKKNLSVSVALALAVVMAGLVWYFIRLGPTPTSRCFTKPQNQSASRINDELVKKSKTSNTQFVWEDYLGKNNDAKVSDAFLGEESNTDIVILKL